MLAIILHSIITTIHHLRLAPAAQPATFVPLTILTTPTSLPPPPFPPPPLPSHPTTTTTTTIIAVGNGEGEEEAQ
jgi:hypothetical protein